jgi:hypothetical protein
LNESIWTSISRGSFDRGRTHEMSREKAMIFRSPINKFQPTSLASGSSMSHFLKIHFLSSQRTNMHFHKKIGNQGQDDRFSSVIFPLLHCHRSSRWPSVSCCWPRFTITVVSAIESAFIWSQTDKMRGKCRFRQAYFRQAGTEKSIS